MTLLEKLIELRDNGPFDRVLGICHNMKTSEKEMSELRSLFCSWPKYSGRLVFPVPHPKLSPAEAFSAVLDLWVGEYGDLRRELLNHLIQELSK